jgi:hypothetical protein
MKRTIVMLLVVAIALIAGLFFATRTHRRAASHAAAAPPTDEAGAPVRTAEISPASPSTRVPRPTAGAAAGVADAGPTAAAEPEGTFHYGTLPKSAPASYQVTPVSSRQVAVNLAGGASGVYTMSDEPGPFPSTRSIRGRVLDETGAPLPGATVIAGEGLRVMFGSLSAEVGAVAGDDGSFALAAPQTALDLVAVHAHGWSPVEHVEAGAGDVQMDLRIDRTGSIEGRLTHDGKPDQFEIRVEGGGLSLLFESDPDGTYRVPVLSPGTYTISAGLTQLIGGGASKFARATVTVSPGETTHQDLDVTTGVLIVVDMTLPAGVTAPLQTNAAYLFAGSVAPATEKDARALAKTLPSGQSDFLLFGGSNTATPIQFHDRDPGPYTICADLAFDGAPELFRCQQLVVAPDPPVRQVLFAF